MTDDRIHTLVPLNSLEDLKKVLFVQKTIAQEVRKELMGVMASKELAQGEVSGPEEIKRMVKGQADLLQKYAAYPTLTEFALQPSLAGATKWGATFGVAIMTRALIIDQVKLTMVSQLAPHIRAMYVLILKELDNPTHDYLIEPLEEKVSFNITMGDGEKVLGERGRQLKRRLLYQLIERLLTASTQYGITEMVVQGGFAITETGRRVLFHLIDSDIFLNELVQAHLRFQKEKPRLNLI